MLWWQRICENVSSLKMNGCMEYAGGRYSIWHLYILGQGNYIFSYEKGDFENRWSRLREDVTLIKWNFRKFKEGLKEKKCLRTPPDSWTPPKRLPSLVDNCLVYVYQLLTSNSNFKTTSNILPISLNFTNPLTKTVYPQIYPYIPPKFTKKSPKRRCVGWA